jgi:hypothetical protein
MTFNATVQVYEVERSFSSAGLRNYNVTCNSTQALQITGSDNITIQNAPPTHSTPTITPNPANTTSDLTCNWNNVEDVDGDSVVNITNWYRNNESITLLYMPFEGGSNATWTKDYSGYGNDGDVSGAVWNRTEGMIGGGYDFYGSEQIVIGDFDLNRPFTVSVWAKPTNLGSGCHGSLVMKMWDYGFEVCDGLMYFEVGNGINSWTATTAYIVPQADVWYFFTAVYNGSVLRIQILVR